MSQIQETSTQISEALSALQHQWQITSHGWKDNKQKAFGKQHIEGIQPVIKPALEEMTKLNQLLLLPLMDLLSQQ